MLNYKEYIRDIYNFPKEGIIFRDIQPLLSHGVMFDSAITDMLNLVDKPDYFIGVDSRGFIFASSMAVKTKNGLKLVRKIIIP